MNTKEKATLNRLAKKLSAIRATLKKDERDMLDRLILGHEVGGHKMTTGKPQRTVGAAAAETKGHASTATAASMKVSRAAKATSDVQAHGMIVPGQTQAAKKMTAAKTDMVLHSMKVDTAASKVQGPRLANTAQAAGAVAASTSSAMLEFDETTGGYRLANSSNI